MAVCYRIVKSKEFSLSYSELSENCTIAQLTNNLEPIVYKYNTKAIDTCVPSRILYDITASTPYAGVGGQFDW